MKLRSIDLATVGLERELVLPIADALGVVAGIGDGQMQPVFAGRAGIGPAIVPLDFLPLVQLVWTLRRFSR